MYFLMKLPLNVYEQVAQRAAPHYAPAKAAHGVLLLEARGDIEVSLQLVQHQRDTGVPRS